MNTALPIAPSKFPKWLRRIMGFVAVVGLISLVVLIDLWIVTRDWTNIVSYSKNAQHFEIRVGGGHLIGCHISNWWTDTELQFSGDSEAPKLNLRHWIGFDIESESRFAACYFARGEYHHPLIDMTNVVTTPHFQPGQLLRFRIFLIPIWIPCVVCALPSVWWLARRRHRAAVALASTTVGDQPTSGRIGSP